MPEPAQFTELEFQEFQSYRPANLWAIGSLAVSLVSALALVHPLLSVISLAAGAIAINALSPLHREAWGRPIAILGLSLAVFFASWGNARFFYRRAVLFSEARKNGDAWLELVGKGQVMQAHQLTREHWERAGPGASLEDHYREPAQAHVDGENHQHQMQAKSVLKSTPDVQLKTFLSQYPISDMVKMDFDWRFARVVSYDWSVEEEKLQVAYRISPKVVGQTPFLIRLVMVRAIENRIAYWRIDNVAGEIVD